MADYYEGLGIIMVSIMSRSLRAFDTIMAPHLFSAL